MKSDRSRGTKRLYGPTVQYADGTVAKGVLLDIDEILQGFERLDSDERSSFLCAFAHDLTVATRALLIDRPVADADIERAWEVNEYLHQLTSCVNPRRRWTAHEEAQLVRSIVESSFNYDLDPWVGHALAIAAGSALRTEITEPVRHGAT
jgi:hypothetical protein